MVTYENNNLQTTEKSYHIKDRSEAEWESSKAAQDLKKLQANPRVKYIVIAAPANACPACQNLVGTYPKDQTPRLPVESCSHPKGCRSYYLPYLIDLYP